MLGKRGNSAISIPSSAVIRGQRHYENPHCVGCVIEIWEQAILMTVCCLVPASYHHFPIYC